jgi:hypothetical protein
MKPLFTIHVGEFLVGDHIIRRLGHKFDVWVPTKDSGVDLLVTRKGRRGASVGLQVKFSRGFGIREDMARHMLAIGWYKIDPKKIKKSQADLWVFVILTLKHEEHFVVIPTRELRKRIPRGSSTLWHLYLSVFDDKSCYQTRDLNTEEKLELHHRGVRDRRRDFSEWLGQWTLLDKLTRKAR